MSILIKGVTLDDLKEMRAYELINLFPRWVEQDRIVEVEEHTAFSNFDDKERKVYVSVD